MEDDIFPLCTKSDLSQTMLYTNFISVCPALKIILIFGQQKQNKTQFLFLRVHLLN